MTSLTVENYVKAIYQICSREGSRLAATGQVASALAVSPGTVTSMLKTLRESGLATYAPYEGVQLTAAGEKLALRVLRRHRLIELFLARTLGLAWDEVHEEAEHMEHAVSDRLIDRIDEYLGFPSFDPHGDPIPRADGSLSEPQGRRLADCPAGYRFRLARVIDQSAEFLRYLSQTGIELDCRGKVESNHPEAGVLNVELPGGKVAIGREAAEKMLVAPPD